jgi:hypothetical protein
MPLLLRNILLIFALYFVFYNLVEAQNPKIKINYKVQRGKMRSYNISTGVIQNTGGACSPEAIFTGLEIRVHAQLRSSTGPTNGNNASYSATSSCPSGTCNACATGSTTLRWGCEQRCETASNAGTCGNWVVNGSQNAAYPGDPGYVDTSSYPSNDILEVQMKGFETDNYTASTDRVNLNFNDGACQTTCASGSCYGNYQIPTSGRYTTIDVGVIGNNTLPHKGANWSSYIPVAYEGANCALDLTGFYAYYYLEYQYRWCWDSTTLNNTHAGLIKDANTPYICSGSTAIINDSIDAFEAVRGFSDYQWQYSTNGTTWIDIAGATSKNLSTTVLTNISTAPITYQIRRVALFCVDFRNTASYRKYPVYSNIKNIIVYPQPIAGTLYNATPASGTTICKGTFVFAQVNAGTGGFTDAKDEYEYEYTLNNGTSWQTYTPPYGISTATATNTIKVRTRRTAGSLSGCNTTAWSEIASWNIFAITPPTLNTATPINNSYICLPFDVSATFNAGSGGGTADEFRYSIDNGNSWNSYTSGNIINTAGADTKVMIQGRRIGGPAPCNPPPFVTLVEWYPILSITNPTLASKIPNRDSVCINETNVSASFNAGSGGSLIARDSFQTSIDNGLNWNAYIPNTNISLVGAVDSLFIRAKRITGETYGCTVIEWDTIQKWAIQNLPIGNPKIDKVYLCDATAKLSVNNLFPNNSSVTWSKISGVHSPNNSNDTAFVVSGIGNSVYNLTVANGACTNVDLGDMSVSTSSITPTTNITLTDNCQYCIVQDGNTKLFFDNNGDLLAEIKDLNVPTTYLDETEICVRINPTQLDVLDNFNEVQPYLRRQWTITPKNNNTNVEVTLYFTDSELSDLRNASLGTPYEFSNYDNLMITKYYGGVNGVFSAPKTTVEELVFPMFSTFGASQHKLSFQTNRFSTIYVHPTRGYFAVLPLELLSFKVVNNIDGNLLSWQTASEVNFYKFEIERSSDAMHWQKIAEIKASNQALDNINHYSFLDEKIEENVNYYRLKMIDLDSTSKFSDIVKIKNNIKIEDIKIYPNPTNDIFYVHTNNLNQTEVKIFNVIGIEMQNFDYNVGNNSIEVDISNFSLGLYHIKINNNIYKVIKN